MNDVIIYPPPAGDRSPLLRHLEEFQHKAIMLDQAEDYWTAHEAFVQFANLALDLPVWSVADLAAKVILMNGDGRWLHPLMLGPNRPGRFMTELRDLAG